MFNTNGELKSCALTYWANYIETGVLHLSAHDALNSGQPKTVRHLDPGQIQVVAHLRALAKEELIKDRTPTGLIHA